MLLVRIVQRVRTMNGKAAFGGVIAMRDAARIRRRFYTPDNGVYRVGNGGAGGKAESLISILETIRDDFNGDRFKGITVRVPHMTVITTEVFDTFMIQNRLFEVDFDKLSDEQITRLFVHACFPSYFESDLRVLVEENSVPLAIRSSSSLEGAEFQPFAGVYATKLIPNHHESSALRLQKLLEAVQIVYASAFYRNARYYRHSIGKEIADEKMAVIIQEVAGSQRGSRFYPAISGIARSFNYYPQERVCPSDGVVELAIGLGKTLVDGGHTWRYCPECPRTPPPFNGISDMLKQTQTDFWAVNTGASSFNRPTLEIEHLVKGNLMEAERDGVLSHTASTFISERDRLEPGIGSSGPRVVDFSPILVLDELPLNDLLRALLRTFEQHVSKRVEFEFVVDMEKGSSKPARFSLLNVRPMLVPGGVVALTRDRMARSDVRIASENVLGNGVTDNICDIVYVKPDVFDFNESSKAATEIEQVNAALVAEHRPYILVGFGRIGTSDPCRGLPVAWSQFSGARVIVEVQREGMETQFSYGAHFFLNLTCHRIGCFSVSSGSGRAIDWQYIETRGEVKNLKYVRHVRTDIPFTVMMDGRTRLGVVCQRG